MNQSNNLYYYRILSNDIFKIGINFLINFLVKRHHNFNLASDMFSSSAILNFTHNSKLKFVRVIGNYINAGYVGIFTRVKKCMHLRNWI